MNENELNLFIMCCALILVMPIGWGLRYSFDELTIGEECDKDVRGEHNGCMYRNSIMFVASIMLEIILLAIVIHTSKKAFKIKKEVGT